MRTLIVGHVTHDYYAEGIKAGGCAFYGAHVHAHLSPTSHLLTAVGEDFQCDDALSAFDATVHRSGPTTTFANYYPPSKPRIQLLETRGAPITPDLVTSSWLDADLVHLAPVLQEIDLLEWKAAAGDGLLAINIQGWIKRAGPAFDATSLEAAQRRGVRGTSHLVVQEHWSVTEDELRGVDIACLGEEDLIDQGDLLERLVAAVPVVALTLGARGSRIYVHGKPTDVGVYRTHVVDPTGAGDVFAATFAHKIASGLHPVEAAQWASAAASIVIEAAGAIALERLGELEGRVKP
ncbi:MAG: PfkB family carbohydrate kinase [Bradymonadaceae bacterium]